MLKGSVHQENIPILNVYIPIITELQNTWGKKNSDRIKRKNRETKIIVEDRNTALSESG